MMTAEQQDPRPQQEKICTNTTAVGVEIKERSYLPSEDLRYSGISSEIPFPPLPTLTWGLGSCGSWLHPFCSLRCTACTWAPLGWSCIPTRCSVTASGHDSAFPLQRGTKVSWRCELTGARLSEELLVAQCLQSNTVSLDSCLLLSSFTCPTLFPLLPVCCFFFLMFLRSTVSAINFFVSTSYF